MIESADEFVRLRISSRREEYVRSAHEEAPEDVWMDVIARYPEMRSWVAHNKTVPIEVLAMLAVDPDPDVRCAVAQRRRLTESLFCRLAADCDASVRAFVASNRKTPRALLEKLAEDPAELVRDAAERRLAG